MRLSEFPRRHFGASQKASVDEISRAKKRNRQTARPSVKFRENAKLLGGTQKYRNINCPPIKSPRPCPLKGVYMVTKGT